MEARREGGDQVLTDGRLVLSSSVQHRAMDQMVERWIKWE